MPCGNGQVIGLYTIAEEQATRSAAIFPLMRK